MSHMRITAATLFVCLAAACGGKPQSQEDGGTAGGAAGGAAAGSAGGTAGAAGGATAGGAGGSGGGDSDAGTAGGSAGGATAGGAGGGSGGGSAGGAMNQAPMLGALSPVTVNEGATAMVTLQATDPDGDAVTFSLVMPPAFVTLAGSTITIAPGFTNAGAYNIAVAVSDGQLQAGGTLMLTVTDVNRPPVLAAIADQQVVAGATSSVMLSATDPDGDTVTFQAMGLPAYVSLAGSSLSFMPGAGVVATVMITIIASDPSMATDSQSFTLTVVPPPNLAPAVSMLAQVDSGGAAVATGAMVLVPPRLRAAVDDPENAQVRLEAEVAPSAAAFTNVATHTGTLGAEGTLTLTLPSFTPGSYKWQLRALDAAGNASAWTAFSGAMTAFVVQAGAINGSIEINSNAAATNSSMVTLALTATATAPATLTEMCFSNDGVTFSQCAAPVASRMWTLTAGEGLRAAYVRVRDSNNTTAIFFDDVVVDVTPPQISSFAIANGAVAATAIDTTLSWAASDALSGVKAAEASNDGTTFMGINVSPSNWVLSATEGVHTVTLRVVDIAGNVATATDTIVLDKTPPVVNTQVLNGGAAWTNVLGASLTVTATDGAQGSGVTEICVAGGAVPECRPFGTGTISITLVGGDGNKQVDVTVKDAAGFTSLPKQAGIGLDTQTPSLTALTVNAGAAWTGSAMVSVATTASDAASGVGSIRCRTDSGGFDSPAAYVTPFGYAMSGGDGMHTVSCFVIDNAGNQSSALSDAIGLDTARPTGTFVVNAGNPQYATSPMATLVFSASDPLSGVTHFCASLTGTAPSGPMDACFTPLAMNAINLGADGPKTVSVWFRDAALNISAMPATDGITLDSTAPFVSIMGAGLGIQAGAAFTRLLANTFDHTASDPGSGLAQVCTGETSPPTSCVPYTAAAPLMLSAGDGMKTAYLRVIDAAGNLSIIVSDGITLDQTPPALSGVLVNLLAQYATNVNVTVTSTASDTNGVPQMQFSNDGNTFAAPVAYASSKAYQLPAGDGMKTVYVRVLDAAGNLSPVVSDGITLDTTPPGVSISVNAGARYANANPVTVAITPTESGSGVYRHCLRDVAVASPAPATPGVADPCFQTFSASVSYMLAAQGDRRVYAWLLDNAGNLSAAPATYDIWLDQTAPAAPGAPSATAGHRVLNVSWGASAGDGSSGVQGYEVGVSQVNGGPYTYGSIVAGTATTLTLANGVTWYLVVRTVDNAGNRSTNTVVASGTPRWPFSHQQRVPTGNNLRSIAFLSGVNRYFVAGTDGALYSSDDGFSTSLRRDPMTDGDVDDVFVSPSGDVWLVGAAGHIARSTDDGVTFDVVTNNDPTLPTKRTLNDVAFAGTGSGMFPPSYYVAVGASGTIVRGSTSFISPTPVFAPVTSGTTSTLNAVARCASAAGGCSAGNVLVAVGANGTILRSQDNGATWASIAAPAGYAAATLNAVAALPNTNTIFIGASSPAGQGPLLRSINAGLNFSEVVIPDFSDLSAINALDGFGNDLWIGAATPSTVIAVLNNTTRTNQTSPSSGRLARGIVARSATEVAVAGDVGQIELTTAPPVWTARSVGTGGALYSLCQPAPFSSLLWQSGQSGWIAASSTSGTLWTQQGSGVTGAPLRSISMVDTNGTMAGVFGFAVGGSGTIVRTSNGGTTWALDSDSGTVTAMLNGVSCRSTTACIAAGNSGAVLVFNGTSWSVDLNGVTRNFQAVTTYQPPAGSVRGIAVGETGLLRTLVASSWANRPDISTNNFYGVAHKRDLGGIVIAVGSSGAIYKSTNHGQDFTSRPSGTSAQLYSVSNVPGTSNWYAVGNNKTALRSNDDGETWSALLTTSTQQLNAVTTGAIAGRVWIAGEGGTTVFSSTFGQ